MHICETKLEMSLNEQGKSIYHGVIRFIESSDAVNEMTINKSSGLDDLSVAFYRVLWDKLRHIITKTYNKIYKYILLTYCSEKRIYYYWIILEQSRF